MTISKLRQRLAALEINRGSVENILLQMPDGSTEFLAGHDAVRLLGQALHHDCTPEMEVIARSVSSTEPDGAHMIDLARALLNSPTDPEPGARG